MNPAANYCINHPEHPMFRATDGAQCVVCKGMVKVKPITAAAYQGLPTYNKLRRDYKTKQEQPKKKYEGILASMGLDLDTAKFEQKLRLIAKHCEALANGLDAIDNAWQCECGSDEYTEETLKDHDAIHHIKRTCLKCKTEYAMPLDELPTKPEKPGIVIVNEGGF